jgi:hypothetical protein
MCSTPVQTSKIDAQHLAIPDVGHKKRIVDGVEVQGLAMFKQDIAQLVEVSTGQS